MGIGAERTAPSYSRHHCWCGCDRPTSGVAARVLGARRLQLVDLDVVDESNRTTHGYWSCDVGRFKVQATAEAVAHLDPTIEAEVVEDRFRSGIEIGEAVFCCVDSITARAAIWKSVHGRCKFWVDGRMLGETIRVLTMSGAEGRQHYTSTLYAQDELITGRCTALHINSCRTTTRCDSSVR